MADVEINTIENQIIGNNFNKSLRLDKYKKHIENLNIKIDFNFINQTEYEELMKFIAMFCQF